MAATRNKKRAVVKNDGGAQGVSPAEVLKANNEWRENYNPLVGLAMQRARTLLEQIKRGEFADYQWTMELVEERFPTLFALIERRASALLELDHNFKKTPDDELPKGCTPEMAETQAQYLRECYDRIDNLKEAIEFLALASFRGFAHLQKQDTDEDGLIDHLECLDQWNWVRRGLRGEWFYNEKALNVNWRHFKAEDAIDEEQFIIREVKRAVGPIALLAFIRYALGMKDWTGFIEIFGIPGGVVIGPPNVPTEKEADYQSAGRSIAKGGSGYLPNGSDFKFNDAPRGVNPFRDFLRYQSEDVVLAGTGGLLTMLAEAGSGTLAGNAHQETFCKIAKAEAAKISEIFNEQFDEPLLEAKFPGQPILAYFQIAANEETDLTEIIDQITKLCTNFTVDPDEASEKTGYTLSAKAPAPIPEFGPGNRFPNRGKGFKNRADVQMLELEKAAQEAYASARAKDLQPLIKRLAEIEKIEDFTKQKEELLKFNEELPALAKQIIADPNAARALSDYMSQAIQLGLQRGVGTRPQDKEVGNAK